MRERSDDSLLRYTPKGGVETLRWRGCVRVLILEKPGPNVQRILELTGMADGNRLKPSQAPSSIHSFM